MQVRTLFAATLLVLSSLVPFAASAQSQDEKRHEADIKADEEAGKKYSVDVEKQFKLSKNKEFQDRAERVGQAIAEVANHNQVKVLWGDKRLNAFHYTYKVLEGDDINAFSLPGGHIYVYEGLMKFIESDDELAGVLGHETAHAAFRHVATLQREENKMLLVQLPLILASILAHSMDAAQATQLYGMASESGWSIKAEKAADYGGFQYLTKSHYNPVAMLTFMERLARKEQFLSPLERNLGILQTHPLSRDRADAMVQNLRDNNIPVKRSKASPSYRVTLKDGFDGSVDAYFGGRKIYTFGGNEAKERATMAVDRLNNFFDEVPQLYEVRSTEDQIQGKGKMLITIEPADAVAAKTTLENLRAKATNAIKQSLLQLAYRVWDGWT
jgi:predicted Zn-dependent protease